MAGRSLEYKELTFSEARERLLWLLKQPYEPNFDMVMVRFGAYSYYDALDGMMRWIVYARYEK